MHITVQPSFAVRHLAGLLLLAWLLSACAGVTADTPAPPTPPPAQPTATRTPQPVVTVDPYTSFTLELKQAVENGDENLLRKTFAAPWFTGRYRTTLTQYTAAAEAVAAYRVIRQRAAAVTLEPARIAAQPADLQKLGERIVVARWDSGSGREEIAYFYASLIDGEWRCVGLVLGLSGDVAIAQASATPLATNAPTRAATAGASATRPATAAPLRGRLVFTRGTSIVVRDAATGAETTVVDVPDASQWDWTSDGTRGVFVRGSGAGSELWSVQRDGSNPRRLTSDDTRDAAPHWSPDGTQILYVHNEVADPQWQLPFKGEVWAMNADGSNKRKLADGFDPQWAPDGLRIAFASNPSSASGDALRWLSWSKNAIRLMNAQGKNEWTPISTDTKSGKFTPLEWTMGTARLLDSPQWSPDNREVTLRVHGGHGAYVSTSSTNGGFASFVALFFDDIARGFSYSPDGRHIAIETGGQSGYRTIGIFRRADSLPDGVGRAYRTLGKAPRAQGDVPQSVLGYAWSPDGSRVAYALATHGSDPARPPTPSGIWVMDLGTGASVQVVPDGTGAVSWLP